MMVHMATSANIAVNAKVVEVASALEIEGGALGEGSRASKRIVCTCEVFLNVEKKQHQ